MHRALDQAQELVRRYAFFLKLDVTGCFDSIRHAVVRETLEPLGLESRARAQFDAVLAGPHGTDTVGLPIGNLTSQWAANLVLVRLDRFVVVGLGIATDVRSMDDFALSADSKTQLREARAEIESFLARELQRNAGKPVPQRRPPPHLGTREPDRGKARERPLSAVHACA